MAQSGSENLKKLREAGEIVLFFVVFFGVDIGVVILPKMKKMVLGRLLFPIGKALFRGLC